MIVLKVIAVCNAQHKQCTIGTEARTFEASMTSYCILSEVRYSINTLLIVLLTDVLLSLLSIVKDVVPHILTF